MTDKLASIFVGIILLVSCVSIGLMILLGEPGDSAGEAKKEQSAQEETGDSVSRWCMVDEAMAENSLDITLPKYVAETDVVIESDYLRKELHITVRKMMDSGEGVSPLQGKFFYDFPVKEAASFAEGSMKETAEGIEFSWPLESVLEFESRFEANKNENHFFVQLISPKDKYEKIVVLDAGHGGSDTGHVISGQDESLTLSEKDIAWDIVSRAGKLLEKEDIKVYYTREESMNPTDEERVRIANAAEADMLISVHADFSQDSSVYGMRTVYNETYFIPNFGSADLAYLLLEKVAASTNEKAIGFEPADSESYLIRNASVPVAQLNVGYLSNKQEQKLLVREEHIERIARGICDAVRSGYEEINK